MGSGGFFMPYGGMESLRPTPDFPGPIEAAVAAIRGQMEARIAEREHQLAVVLGERQELLRLVTDAQTAVRISREETAGLRAELSACRTRLHWALGRRR
jgi:hypothetical protein